MPVKWLKKAGVFKSSTTASPVRKCVSCLYSLGYGTASIERVTGYNRGASAKWLKRCGVYTPERAAERRDKRAAASRRRKKGAKFPLALSAFWPPCRVEKVKVEKAPLTTDERNAKALAYYYANRDKVRALQKESLRERMRDPEYRKQRNAVRVEWHKSNPAKKRQYYTKAKGINPERFRAYLRKHRAKPYNRIVLNLRKRLREIVKRKGGSVTSALTGCSASTLKLHLQSQFKRGMAWNNYGTAWVVDHIVPCAKFDLSIKSQQQACFHFSNLRPLFAQENADKSDSIVPCQPELVLVL